MPEWLLIRRPTANCAAPASIHAVETRPGSRYPVVFGTASILLVATIVLEGSNLISAGGADSLRSPFFILVFFFS